MSALEQGTHTLVVEGRRGTLQWSLSASRRCWQASGVSYCRHHIGKNANPVTVRKPHVRQRLVARLARAGNLARAYNRITSTASVLDAADRSVQEKIRDLLLTRNS